MMAKAARTPVREVFVCSNVPRPSVQKAGKGHEHWRRDVFHARHGNRTLCGVDCLDWLVIDGMTTADAMVDPHFCERCSRLLKSESRP